MHNYNVVYSSRKTLAIEVKKDGRVVVRAPFGVSNTLVERFLLKHSRWIEKTKERLLNRPDISLSDQEVAELKNKANEVLPPIIAHYSALTGLVPASVKITSAKTRFGSCSGKNAICFSYRLMLYPNAAIEYVVLHELAHIKYKNHQKEFYEFVEKYMPDYKNRIVLLKET